MRRLRHLAALAGSACVMLAGMLAGGASASAVLVSLRPNATAVPSSSTATTTTLALMPGGPGNVEY